ncbi:MAG TPA: hypothetical protein VM657_15540 [Sphingomonas sp.]|nr:hypothetical protein [Sphingomonas sp.]
MARIHPLLVAIAASVALAGCASKPKHVAVAPPPPPAPAPQPMPQPPAGTAAGIAVPPKLADGRYATPNTGLSAPAALWHMRTGLNVAALGCRGANEAAIIAGYNALLESQKTPLAKAHQTLVSAQGEAGFDDAMTRLYNYWAQPGAQADFCAAANRVLLRAPGATPATIDTFAASAITELDQPFVDLFRAYDAYRIELAQWQANRTAVALQPVETRTVLAAAAAPASTPGSVPQIAYDPSIFTMP